MKCVYKITNLLDGRFYIGSTTNFKRRYHHWRDYTSNTYAPMKRDILKYGRDNFKIEPIEIFPEGATRQEVAARELELIHELNPEYNVLGKPRPKSTREKLAKAQLGKKMPPEVGRKISASQKERHKTIPQTNEGHLKDVLIIETGEVIHGVKNAEDKLGVSRGSITRALKRNFRVRGFHVCLLRSVETSCDECSSVGEKMSYSSKCTTSERKKI
jgi:hypothetical protein